MKIFITLIAFLTFGLARAQQRQAGMPTEAENLKMAAMDAYEKKNYGNAVKTIRKAVTSMIPRP